ncbi:hypothetical protein GCM10011609_27700 [Lentzea pudingi]|uniref:Uncharacterized protein n=1 Tax=Lentzea pudingi TaxID=1789439 RepID=A0ABQ2HR85_9PSEU|nr:hypothetical protein [Lentzea pudingi]GGM89297.1 hypothetical protein GCM10011609_27700 [Lentzea pudingi]
MDWNNVLWALVAALVIALVATALAWVLGIRRRRAHSALVRNAVTRMCAQRPEHPGRLTRLTREVVSVLLRQEEGAVLLDRGERHGDAERMVSATADTAMLVAADAATAPHTLARRRKTPDDSIWNPQGQAPRVASHPELAVLCSLLRRTTDRRIARARLVIGEAERLGDQEDEDCGARLRAAFDRATAGLRNAADLAAAGHVLAALDTIVHLDLPVPEEGVPGQADVADQRAQVNALAKLALRHRAALDSHRQVVTVLSPLEQP